VPTMVLQACTFGTARLVVKEWHSHSPSDWQERDLPRVVSAMLTEPVTRSLPSGWHGSYTTERAHEWIKERDRESTNLLVVDKSTQQAVGLMILSEMQAEVGNDYIDVRLGYFVSEDSWGQGIASELVDGFVTWCRAQTSISSIAGGVALDNPASQRVLRKNGFRLSQGEDEVAQDEQTYRLRLR
jgi:ribosomal-protein-alanine N-acetyltransferase